MNKSILFAAIAALGLAFAVPASAQTDGRLIVSQVSGKCLDVPGISNFTPGTPLQLWDCETTGFEVGGKHSDQFWVFAAQGNIRNTLSGLCIDITGSNPGSHLQIMACDGRAESGLVRASGRVHPEPGHRQMHRRSGCARYGYAAATYRLRIHSGADPATLAFLIAVRT